jgi:NADPH2:quinone reductase
MRAIRVHQYGGPEVLKWEEQPAPKPEAGQALVRLEAVGVNYIDIYHRTGLYKNPLPFTLGLEGAGVVEAVGAGVSEVRVGERVAYQGVQGSYATHALVPAARLVSLPTGLDARTGAAAMLQGMTAHYLVHATYPLKPGETVLLHAAAGGVGLLLIQMAKRLGARVLGTVSTPEKARLAKEAGADEIIQYTTQDFEAEVKRLTGGRGVPVVYDSVGKTTFEKSLNVLAPRGTLVLFGQASGPVPPLDLGTLAAKGSLYVTRPTLGHYVATREELLKRAGEVLGWVKSGELKLRIEHTFPLAQAAEAHRALEGRRTTGKVLLLP